MEGKDSVVNFNSFPVHRHLAETEKGTVKKPYYNAKPDQKNNHMLRVFLEKGPGEKEEDNSHREEHNAVLDKEGFYNKGLSFHEF